MNNIENHARRELDILQDLVDESIVGPFSDEIVALCKKFGNSGQSGATAPFTATAISQAVKKLLLCKTIMPLTGADSEWNDVTKTFQSDITTYQNNRDSSYFKDADGRVTTIGITFQESNGLAFTGSISDDIGSGVDVTLPCMPKIFYVDVKKELYDINMHGDMAHVIGEDDGDFVYSLTDEGEKQYAEAIEYFKTPYKQRN